MFQNIKNTRFLTIQAIIWIIGILSMISVFHYFFTPIYERAITDPADYEYTQLLSPGDIVTQTFVSDKNSFLGFEIAFSHNENTLPNTNTIIRVLQNDSVFLEQPLPVVAAPNDTFLYLNVPLKDCLGDTITVQVENVSQDPAHTFALLTAKSPASRPSDLANYSFNQKEQDTCLLFRTTYCSGYTYYKALTASTFVLLITLAASAYVTSKRLRK